MRQVSAWFDEDLLRQLDDYAEAHDRGRSAVLREAVTIYLARDGSPSPGKGDVPVPGVVDRRAGDQNPALSKTGTGTHLSSDEIVRRYREGYGKLPPTEDELNGWEDEEAWPNE